MVDVGDKAPAFEAAAGKSGGSGGMIALKDLKGKKAVLYFYPKDDTPGCTTEAKDFTELKRKFSANGITVVGVSKDSVAKHDKFADKHDLRITLASDEDGAVCDKYGVWVEKKNYGRTYMGIERSTFLIDAKGRIAKVWRKVRVKGHAEAVLAVAKEI
ncbi:MAG: thioredoxin-dependent thiol peroxidase [Alphaproteobacteria bacterium]|jgi:peroxiredoxin Q/BCP|nr:thioredoxin-dependent thiol peroxidase [Rhodospirillaceae bacterium]MDP6022937.1 thioredoxin-dependent thiol peroxidase [Alphaproteobacteria bacterium]MDP6253792.1 thioredoxin-dependent thiol peroxidase [Alphaproteobacteria bacterium]MDP7055788.1 thioredoxin-dependent thiol peroxidase [Alphaproteobacteria bacterium]MDP7230485.1 thioredoxin-dependent thiol peroxidase [Alphaproteobacteria bacterium]|tara:strand:+ start:2701 stop:3174 length:474 start_codon:yes stop_codon:yes gene_type:complete